MLIQKILSLVKRENKGEGEDARRTDYQSLTPIDDAEISGYRDALDFVYTNPKILNIAVSGPYGSGKSSVINTYSKLETEDNKKKYLDISLAHFSGNNVDVENVQTRIINQLTHKIDSEIVKEAGFAVRNKDDKLKNVINAFLIAFEVFLFSIFQLQISMVKQFLDRPNELEGITSMLPVIVLFLVGIVLVINSCVLIYGLLGYNNHFSSLKKIKTPLAELELDCEESNTVFDKYLDKLVYLLSMSSIDVIVFEDIDRFDDTCMSIFEQLRNINELSNFARIANKKKIEKNKPLRFFYLIRDDVFADFKDRTKFFDFIIPVVPIVDGSNAFNKVIEYLPEFGNVSHETRRQLKTIASYLDDLRIIKTIANEYKIYKAVGGFSDEALDDNGCAVVKLFSLITYKNLFPNDFQKLYTQQGAAYILSSEV